MVNQETSDNPTLRKIRSFVRREGRLTAGQQLALDTLWPEFGVETSQAIDMATLFGNNAPVTLEIGFGNGQSLITMAQNEPDANFLGIEVHRPGVGHLLHQIASNELQNIRVICHDAVDVIHRCIPMDSLQRTLLFFPDPWPKRKHLKRRIIQPEFVKLISTRMQTAGLLHLATDWEPYAKHMINVVDACPAFRNLAGKAAFTPRPGYRPMTKFENRGAELGHSVYDLIYQKA